MHRQDDNQQQEPTSNESSNQVSTNDRLIEDIITTLTMAKPLQKIEENASAYYEKGISEAKNLEKKIETNIRENPTKSLLIAAGVGLFAWALWNRK